MRRPPGYCSTVTVPGGDVNEEALPDLDCFPLPRRKTREIASRSPPGYGLFPSWRPAPGPPPMAFWLRLLMRTSSWAEEFFSSSNAESSYSS